MHEEMRDALNDNSEAIRKQNIVLDKIADGAQAQILSANILHGNASLGLKGFIPDMTERMSAVEAELHSQATAIDERHAETSGRLDKIEANQGKLKRCMDAVYKWTSGPDGKTHRHWIWVAIATAMTWLLTFVSDHMGWYWGRKLLHLFAR